MEGDMRNANWLLLLSLSILIVVLSTTQISEYDFWWHLGLGNNVFTTWNINSPDVFSYTIGGQQQFNAEWLGDLLIFAAFKIGGLAGVYALKAAMLLLTAMFLYLAFRNSSENKNPYLAAAAALVIVFLSLRFRLYIRPFLFSYLFLSIFLYVITDFLKNRENRILLVLLPIELLWANMSKGAFYGPMLLTIFALGEFLNRRPAKRLAAMTLLVMAISLINPEWYRIYSMPFSMAVIDKEFVLGEHQPLSMQILWGYGFRYTWAYQVLALGSIFYILLRGWRKLSHVFLFIAFFVPSIMLVRLIDFFSIIAGLLVFKLLDGTPMHKLESKSPAATHIALAAVIFALSFSAINSKIYAFGVGVKESIFPVEGLAFLEKHGLNGRVFNSYPYGGYLIWNSPERKIFIDGRGPQAYSPRFFTEYLEVLKSAEAWEKAEERYGFNIAVLEYDLISGNAHYPMHLNKNTDWALVYWDSNSAIFLKRVPENMSVIEANEYRILRPSMYDFSYLDMQIRHGKAAGLMEEIDREIALNKLNQEPRLAKAYLAFNAGLKEVAFDELKAALDLKPDLAMEHSSLAMLYYEKGENEKGNAEVDAALKIDPMDTAANELKKMRDVKKGH